jgi:Putative holin
MLVGVAVGVLLGVTATLLITAPVRPDVAIALALGVPTLMGLSVVLFSSRRWMTAVGAFLVAVSPGWFSVLVLTQVVHGA